MSEKKSALEKAKEEVEKSWNAYLLADAVEDVRRTAYYRASKETLRAFFGYLEAASRFRMMADGRKEGENYIFPIDRVWKCFIEENKKC